IGEDLQEYGFTMTEQEFIDQFSSYMKNLKMRRGGTYAALKDTQTYIKENRAKLPQARRPFYDWFSSIDLWRLVDESSDRPLREAPFKWDDYKDLYPELATIKI